MSASDLVTMRVGIRRDMSDVVSRTTESEEPPNSKGKPGRSLTVTQRPLSRKPGVMRQLLRTQYGFRLGEVVDELSSV